MKWFFFLRAFFVSRAKLASLEVRTLQAEKEFRKLKRESGKTLKQLSRIREESNQALEQAEATIVRQRQQLKKQELLIDTLKVEIELAEKVTVPSLIAANKTIHSAHSTTIAVNDAREAALLQSGGSEG